jgi:hypothetical protein
MVVTVSSSSSHELILSDLLLILQYLHRCSSAAHYALMGSFIIVVFQPVVQILLQLIKVAIELLAECDLVELVQDRLMEAFADAIDLRCLTLCLGMVNVVDCQEQVVIVSLCPAG